MVLGDEREDDAENGNGKDRKNQLSELSLAIRLSA